MKRLNSAMPIVFIYMSAYLLPSCEASKDQTSSTAPTATELPPPTEEPSNQNNRPDDSGTTGTDDADDVNDAGTIALVLPSTPNEVVIYLDTSVRSALTGPGSDDVKPMTQGTLAVDLALTADTPPLPGQATAYCSIKGSPIHADPAKNVSNDPYDLPAHMSMNDPDYAIGKFFCMLSHNNYDQRSVQGAYAMIKDLLCATKNVPRDGTQHNVEIPRAGDNSCFVMAEGDEMADVGMTLVTKYINKPAFGGQGWDYGVTIDVTISAGGQTIGPVPFKTLFKSNASGIAMALLSKPFDSFTSSDWDSFVLSVNPTAGELRYELKSQRMNKGIGQLATRLLAKGNVDKQGAFTALDSYEGITGSGSIHPTNTNTINQGFLYSIKGSKATGYRTVSFQCRTESCTDILSYTEWDRIDGGTRCYGSNSGCSGVNEITLKADTDLKFLMPPQASDYLTGETWFNSLVPPVWTAIALSDRQ